MSGMTKIAGLMLGIGLLAGGSAQAAVCSTSDVKVTSISIAGGPVVDSHSYVAAECAGAYVGMSIPVPGTGGGNNLGYYGDGLFNGAPQGGHGTQTFTNGIFYDQYKNAESDLNNDGIKDPGWIYLGTWTPGKGFTTAAIGGISTVVLNSWFTVTGTGSSGTWAFTPDKDVASRVAPVLGSNLFDQFALSFMSGDTFAAYDFTGAEFGMPTSSQITFNFSGTWDMSKTLLNGGGKAGNLSHIDLYVRDPNANIQRVPEPASLALASLGLIALGWNRRRRASDAS